MKPVGWVPPSLVHICGAVPKVAQGINSGRDEVDYLENLADI
jgi:hypothetical protein